jgi:hypothetical protein
MYVFSAVPFPQQLSVYATGTTVWFALQEFAPTIRLTLAGQVIVGPIVSTPRSVAVQVEEVVPDASTALIEIVVEVLNGIIDPAAGVCWISGSEVQLSDAV